MDPTDQDGLVGARHLMLTSTAAELGFTDAAHRPWGVAIDIGLGDEAAATVVSLQDGTTSLYTTTGGGILGGGEHEDVAAASRRLVEQAARHVEDVVRRDDVDLPGAGHVTLWLRIGDERFARTVPEAELMSGESPLASLYAVGHEVITQLRLLDDSRAEAAGDES